MWVCVHECTSTLHTLWSQRYQIPWSLSHRWLGAVWHEYWELNTGPLKEQKMSLTIESSLSSHPCFKKKYFSVHRSEEYSLFVSVNSHETMGTPSGSSAWILTRKMWTGVTATPHRVSERKEVLQAEHVKGLEREYWHWGICAYTFSYVWASDTIQQDGNPAISLPEFPKCWGMTSMCDYV